MRGTASIGKVNDSRLREMALSDEDVNEARGKDHSTTQDYLRVTINGRHFTSDQMFEAYAELVRP